MASFDRSDGVMHWCRLGSEAARSVSPYLGSDNGNGSDHNSPLPPPGPKKKGRPPKNKPKGVAASFALFVHRKLELLFISSGDGQFRWH